MSMSCAGRCKQYSVHAGYHDGAGYCRGCTKYMQLPRVKCHKCAECKCEKCKTPIEIAKCKCPGCKGLGCAHCRGFGLMKARWCPCCKGKIRYNAKKKKTKLHRF